MINPQAILSELRPFADMTVGRSTVSNLVFTSEQTLYSTGLIDIATAATIPSNAEVDLFKTSIGSTGQGWGSAFTLTRGQTNMENSDNGRLPANEVFIATHCSVAIFKRSANAGATTETEHLIQSGNLVKSITNHLSFQVTVGDGITRNYGSLSSFPIHGGAWGQAPNNNIAAAATTTGTSRGAQNGCPCPGFVTKLSVPIVFAPNISVAIKVRGGSALAVGVGTSGGDTEAGVELNYLATTDYLGICMYLPGYLLTNPA